MHGEERSGESAGDLIQEVLLMAEEQEVQERKAYWRRLRRKVLGAIVLGAALTAGGVALSGWLTARGLEGEVAAAAEALRSDASLANVATRMESSLEALPDHAPSQTVLALARVRQAFAGRIEAERALEEVLRARESSVLQAAERAMWAQILTNEPVADPACLPAVADDHLDEQAAAFLCGWTALSHLHDAQLLRTAQAHLERARTASHAWDANVRLAAAIAHQVATPETALQILESAKPDGWTWNVAVDDALYRGLLHDNPAGVLKTADAALEETELGPRTHALAHLAKSTVLRHRGELEAAARARSKAWTMLPAFDAHGRDLAFGLAVEAGAFEEARAHVESLPKDHPRRSLYAAWLAHARGEQRVALESLAKLPQDSPVVARLQALALIEQGRLEEAKPWVEYATNHSGERLDLRVASLRTSTRPLGERIAKLAKLAEEHPHAPRVWTALGLARVEAKQSVAAEAAWPTAVEREPVAADAAFALARLLEDRLAREPGALMEVRDLYAKAAKWRPEHAPHVLEHGAFLARVGLFDEAHAVLSELSERDDAPPSVWLELAAVQMRHDASSKGRTLARELIDEAKQAGAPAEDLALARARVDLLEGTSEALAHAVAVLEPVIARDRRFTPHRVALAEALRLQGKLDDARSALLVAASLDGSDGHISIGLARVERSRDNDRSAAGYASRGWRRLASRGASPVELLEVAPDVTGLWIAIDRANTARSIGRELARRVPHLAQSWVIRGQAEFAADDAEGVCETAEQAAKVAADDPSILALMADCHVKRREFSAARKVYRDALAKTDDRTIADPIRRRLARVQ